MGVPEDYRARDEVIRAAFQFRNALLAFANTLVRDLPLAEDAVQESFLVVMRDWKSYREGSSIYHWVRKIVRNRALYMLRSRRREMTTDEEKIVSLVAEEADSCLRVEDAETQNLVKRALQECMSRLNRFSVQLLAGFYWRMESCDSLAGTHKRSVNAIRLALSRLRQRLRECLRKRLAHDFVGLEG